MIQIIAGGILTVLEELNVKHVIIGKQFDDNNNLKEFKNIIKRKRIKVKIVEQEQKINIENNLYLDILWPNSKNQIIENSINNNALVFKLNYILKNNNVYSILFTGDIEKEAEEILASKYRNTSKLKSTVLKVGHHGSKTSSTEDFLKLIKPKIALIGVGKNNTFGHPNSEVLNRLENLNCKIYRTDLYGEINITINNKGVEKIIKKINKKINYTK